MNLLTEITVHTLAVAVVVGYVQAWSQEHNLEYLIHSDIFIMKGAGSSLKGALKLEYMHNHIKVAKQYIHEDHHALLEKRVLAVINKSLEALKYIDLLVMDTCSDILTLVCDDFYNLIQKLEKTPCLVNNTQQFPSIPAKKEKAIDITV